MTFLSLFSVALPWLSSVRVSWQGEAVMEEEAALDIYNLAH
jgi:hypothetical protein